MFQLTAEEYQSLISQNAISNKGRGGRRKLSYVFTEKDVAKFNSQYPKLTVKINEDFHDRFIIIDRKEVYHKGASSKMKPRELCEKAWQEIAGNFPDFKIIGKGQTLKKTSKNKDLTYEIYFQANRNNYECSVEFIPHIAIYSKGMKKANINNGFVYGGELGTLLGRTPFKWWQLSGASYKYTVEEVSGLIRDYIMPIFDDFEDTETNIENILNGKLTVHNLLYYIYYFGGKDKAEKYLNKILKEDKFKNKYISFYNKLKEMTREEASQVSNEFNGAGLIKFVYINGLEIEA